MSKKRDFSDADLKTYFGFLEDLRKSGKTNMFGAPQYLREAFGLSKEESYDVFSRWTDQFKA